VPTPGYGSQALQAWSAPACVSKTTRQPGPDASRAYPERRFVRERGKVRDGVNVVTSVNVSTSRSLDLRVHVRLNQHQRPPHVESRKRPATSNPGYGPSRRMPKTSLHAQSLKGISTIAWGCHSAAPATPGRRPQNRPNSVRVVYRGPILFASNGCGLYDPKVACPPHQFSFLMRCRNLLLVFVCIWSSQPSSVGHFFPIATCGWNSTRCWGNCVIN